MNRMLREAARCLRGASASVLERLRPAVRSAALQDPALGVALLGTPSRHQSRAFPLGFAAGPWCFHGFATVAGTGSDPPAPARAGSASGAGGRGGKGRSAALQDELPLPMEVISVRRTCKVTKAGGVFRFKALVVVGNGKGFGGYGLGRASDAQLAVSKAYRRAARSLLYFDLYEGGTIYHAAEAKVGRTKVMLWPTNVGEGRYANNTIISICELAGIRCLRAKVIGSHNAINTVRATFLALDSITTPEEMAYNLRLRIVPDKGFVEDPLLQEDRLIGELACTGE